MSNLSKSVHRTSLQVHKEILSISNIISDTSNISQQREQFMLLYTEMPELAKVIKDYELMCYPSQLTNKGNTAKCLSIDKEINNLYYDTMMLKCGKTVEKLKL